MPLEIKQSIQDGCNVTEFNVKEESEPVIYDLQYLVYRLDLQREFKLNDMETKLISFILSYANVSDKFYFGNVSMGKLFDKTPKTISRGITSLAEKGLIITQCKVMAGGGEIRFVRLNNNVLPGWTKMSRKDGHKCPESNNKINKNKYNNNIYTKGTDLVVGNDLINIVQTYNQAFNKTIESTRGFEKNYLYWKGVHSAAKIVKAIENASKDGFWRDKMTLTILFRQKNGNGEPVDYIEDLSTRAKTTGSIGII